VTARLPAAHDPARDGPRAAGVPRGQEDLLGPTPEIDSDAPAIRALAAEVAGDAGGAYAAARRLNQHVHRRLQKTFGQSRDRASEVLTAGQGDCTEHALLLVALARAAGIPARLVHGLVYARYGDQADALYWHAWAEVRSAGEWIAMDPTFGQDLADATHLALGRGTQVDTVGLLGALEVVAAAPVPIARQPLPREQP
jgi:transglutaminase-like putative cysteine protease